MSPLELEHIQGLRYPEGRKQETRSKTRQQPRRRVAEIPPPRPAGLRVVAIGGGTGLSTLLRGLKRHVAAPNAVPNLDAGLGSMPEPFLISDLAAVVTVTDDGGSSGRLREDLHVPPPGDVRNCMVALSEDEHLLSKLFQFRFSQGELQGHSFGNLFVAALSQINGGDFAHAVQMSSQILATRGRIYPATNTDVTLQALMDDGSLVSGETNITASKRRIVELRMNPADAPPLAETLDAIANADLITFGPGSLYTSLITNLLIRGIPEAIAASRATRVYVCNLMTQANESIGLTASQHIERIFAHASRTGAPILDYALINTTPISPTLVEQYAREGQNPVVADLDRVRALGVEPITGNFLNEGDVLRHDYDLVTEALLKLPRAR